MLQPYLPMNLSNSPFSFVYIKGLLLLHLTCFLGHGHLSQQALQNLHASKDLHYYITIVSCWDSVDPNLLKAPQHVRPLLSCHSTRPPTLHLNSQRGALVRLLIVFISVDPGNSLDLSRIGTLHRITTLVACWGSVDLISTISSTHPSTLRHSCTQSLTLHVNSHRGVRLPINFFECESRKFLLLHHSSIQVQLKLTLG